MSKRIFQYFKTCMSIHSTLRHSTLKILKLIRQSVCTHLFDSTQICFQSTIIDINLYRDRLMYATYTCPLVLSIHSCPDMRWTHDCILANHHSSFRPPFRLLDVIKFTSISLDSSTEDLLRSNCRFKTLVNHFVFRILHDLNGDNSLDPKLRI